MTSLPISSLAETNNKSYKLANGLTVMIERDTRFPLVSSRLYVRAGSTYEEDHERGLSHLLEHMVFKGTKKRSTTDIANDIEKIGGYLNAATSFDYTVYLTDVPKDYWQVGIEVIQDMVFNHVIDAEELESEKKVVIAELNRGLDNPGNLLFQDLHKNALAGSPYEHPIIGYEKVINKISPQDISNYTSRLYQPQSMLLYICGDVDIAKVEIEIERLFAEVQNTASVFSVSPVEHTELILKNSPVVSIKKGDWNKIYLSIGFPSTRIQDGRNAELDILTSMLSGGQTSYFYNKYKYKKQLVDSISLSNYNFERLGLLTFNITLDPKNFNEFWSLFTEDLANINELKFTEEELKRAKLNIQTDFFRSAETLATLASKNAYFAFFDLGKQAEKNYHYTVQNTSLIDLQNQLADIVVKERLVFTLLAPKANTSDLTTKNLTATLNKNWKSSSKNKAAKNTELKTNKPEVIDLGNNRKLILIADKTMPFISADLIFNGGDSLLSPDKQGLSILTAAMLTKGTKNLNASEFADFLDDRASYFSANSGKQSFIFSFSNASAYTQDLFNLLNTVMLEPAFLEEELIRTKNNQLASIKASEDQPVALAMRKMFSIIFEPNHPYAYQNLGEATQVAIYTLEDVQNFWKEQKEQPWTLAICGDFERADIIKLAKAIHSPKAKAKAKDLPVPTWAKAQEVRLQLAGRQQAHMFLLFPTVDMYHPDSAAVSLMHMVLQGQSGILFTELRDKQGLAYTVTAYSINHQKSGVLMFYIGTTPDKLEEAKQGFLTVIVMLKTELLDNELLLKGKNSRQGDYYRAHQSLGSRSSEAATLAVLGAKADFNQKEIEKLFKVNAEEVRTIANKYLNLDKAYWIIVEP